MTSQCKDPIVHAVGDVAILFANLEWSVAGAIWILLAGKDEQIGQLAQAITAEMSFDRKVHAFSSLYKLKFPNHANDPALEKLVAKLFEASDIRNQLLHSAWSYSDEGGHRSRIKASAKAGKSKGLRTRVTAVTPQKMNDALKILNEVGYSFGKFAIENIQKKLRG